MTSFDIMSEDIDISGLDINIDETQVMVESETNWNNIMMSIGIAELAETESGEVITEAEAPAFFKKIGDFIKKAWDNVVAFVKKILTNISAFFSDNKTFLKKYSDRLNKITVPSGFSYKGYDYISCEKAQIEFGDDLEKTLNSYFAIGADAIADLNDDAIATIKSAMENYNIDDENNKLRGQSVGKDSIASGDYKNELFKFFRNGQSEKHDIKDINIKGYMDTMSDFENIKNTVNKSLENLKKTKDKMLKAVSDAERKLKNNSDKDKDKANTAMRYFKLTASCINSQINMSMQYVNSFMQAKQEQVRVYKSVLTKLLTGAKGKSDSSDNKNDDTMIATKESTEFGMSHFNPFANVDLI